MPSWAQGLLKPLSISTSSFLPLLAGGVIACSIRRPREGKCVSLNCLWACRWGISDHQCVFHWNEPCNWVCEVWAHEGWQPPNLDAAVGHRVGEKIHLLYNFSWTSWARCRSYQGALIRQVCLLSRKKGSEREKLSVRKSVKERIPNLPKSSANPVSPCSLILSILNARSWRRMDSTGEALRGEEKNILLCSKNLFWDKNSRWGTAAKRWPLIILKSHWHCWMTT